MKEERRPDQMGKEWKKRACLGAQHLVAYFQTPGKRFEMILSGNLRAVRIQTPEMWLESWRAGKASDEELWVGAPGV